MWQFGKRCVNLPIMSRINYDKYNPELSVEENAEILGCKVSTLRKYIQKNQIDRKYDTHYLTWKKINDFRKAHPNCTLRQKSSELGVSINTIRKYEAMSEEELDVSFRDADKISSFDIKNINAIKSISSNQSEILRWIIRLYNENQMFEADLTASTLKFYKHLSSHPQFLYDKYPQLSVVRNLDEADTLPDSSFSSIVYDLPFIISDKNTDSVIKDRFTYFYSAKEAFDVNIEMLNRAYRLLAPNGLLVVKTMDVAYSGKQYWISDFILREAEKKGLELLDKFILLSNLRLFSKTRKQRIARKYHSYFFVFRKVEDTLSPISDNRKCLIADFDNTIFDTSSSSKLRNVRGKKDWDKIFACIPKFKLYAGWEDVFKYIKENDIRFGVVSAAKKELIERTFKHFGIKCNAIIGYQRCYKKPHPKLMEMAFKKLNVASSQVIYTGNGIEDLELAKVSETRFIGACWDSQDKEVLSNNGEIISNPRELIEYLK